MVAGFYIISLYWLMRSTAGCRQARSLAILGERADAVLISAAAQKNSTRISLPGAIIGIPFICRA